MASTASLSAVPTLDAHYLVDFGELDDRVGGQVLAGEGGDVVDHEIGLGMPADLLEMLHGLVLSCVTGVYIAQMRQYM